MRLPVVPTNRVDVVALTSAIAIALWLLFLPVLTTTASAQSCEPASAARLALLDERVGFGRNTTGGAGGCIYHVTNLGDSGPGSLRAGAVQSNKWIVFDVSGVIKLSTPIDVAPNTTFDGRGANITLSGNGLYMVNRANVIISHLKVVDVLTGGNAADAIQIRKTGTKDVWVHHVTIANVQDGYVDITQGATNVTVSWSRFERSPSFDREKAILIGANDPGDPDELSFVTLHHNFFNGTQQRNPLIRSATVHSFNNYIRDWGIYGSGVGDGGRLLSDGNVYEDGEYQQFRAFIAWDEGPAYIRSSGDAFLMGASGADSSPSNVPDPPYPYYLDSTATLVSVLTAQTGHQSTFVTASAGASTPVGTPVVTRTNTAGSAAPQVPNLPAAGNAAAMFLGGSIPSTGFGLVVFAGGTNAQLLAASACPADTAAFWATNSAGEFDMYIPGVSVELVNAAWNARFASGIPAGTPLIGKCR